MLCNLTESITIEASLLYSFILEASSKILAQLNTGKKELAQMNTLGPYPPNGKVMDKPEILFARMDMKEMMEKVEAIYAAGRATERAHTKGANDRGNTRESGNTKENVIDVEAKPEMIHEDFAKLRSQVGEVIRCETIPKSKKLLCSRVKIGNQTRQIISDTKACYSSEETVGKKVMMVTNLKSARLVGTLSEGALLCATDVDDGLVLMKPERDMSAGAEIC